MNQLRDAIGVPAQHMVRHLALWPLAALLCACLQPASGASAGARPNGQHALGIVGFNYTGKYIDQFYVNGAGGPNLDPSTVETGAGGSIVCCVSWRDGTPLPKTVHVRWTFDACEYTSAPNIYGERFDTVHNFFKEQEVQLKGPVPKNPGYFEVHFYPDGHIEVAITEQTSELRVLLHDKPEPPMRRCGAEEIKEFKQ
jgi:hypothetical protein